MANLILNMSVLMLVYQFLYILSEISLSHPHNLYNKSSLAKLKAIVK